MGGGGMHAREGHAWQGACVAGSMHGREGVSVVGVVRAGDTATEAGDTHPTGMHSCLYDNIIVFAISQCIEFRRNPPSLSFNVNEP